MRCSIKSFYPYILEKARFGSVWCTVKMIFQTSQMPSQSKFSQINHITRTNQIMLSNTQLPIKLHIKKEGLETLFFISKGETRTLDLSGMSRTL